MSLIRAYLGGSFNPIHQGHIQIVKESIDLLNLQTVTLLPCKDNHLKQIDSNLSSKKRMAYINETVNKHSFLKVDYRELQSKQPHSYTIDTIFSIKKEHPQDSLIFIMGSDTFKQMHQWKRWEEITDYCHLLVFQRADDHSPLHENLNEIIHKHLVNKQAFLENIKDTKMNKLLIFDMQKPIPISSSQIRRQSA